ncbi:MAG: hypothetical protein K2O54_03045 [Prevotella sp.]|nr:hypothetical protein [Prevotella sp.]
MKYELKPIISADEIERAVEAKYGDEIDLRNLFFECDYANDSYKALSFDSYSIEDAIEDWEEEPENPVLKQRIHVLELLRDEIKDYDCVLVDVSW